MAHMHHVGYFSVTVTKVSGENFAREEVFIWLSVSVHYCPTCLTRTLYVSGNAQRILLITWRAQEVR